MRNPRLRGSSVITARHTLVFHFSVSLSATLQMLCAGNTDQYMFFLPPRSQKYKQCQTCAYPPTSCL